MNWFPWLNPAYRQLAGAYQEGHGHHALLLHGQEGVGTDALAYGLSRYLMCEKPDGMKSCGNCHSCRLMLAQTHPDYYQLQPEKNKSAIGVDAVRQVNEKLYEHARLSGAKLVVIPQTELLTEAAANALLKTLEEPAAKTYFILLCEQPSSLLATLRSRCFYYHLIPPETSMGLYWLQKECPEVSYADALTALKLAQDAPIAAKSLLAQDTWQSRNTFYQALITAIEQQDCFSLLAQLSHDTDSRIYWLVTLLMDALKQQQNAASFCINQDYLPLTFQLAQKMSSANLLSTIEGWLACRHQLLTISGVNQELLLTEQLLRWEQLLR